MNPARHTPLLLLILATALLAPATLSAKGFSYGYRDTGNPFAYVVVRGDGESLSGSGDEVDFEQVRKIRKEV